jgi:hypothetical protein
VVPTGGTQVAIFAMLDEPGIMFAALVLVGGGGGGGGCLGGGGGCWGGSSTPTPTPTPTLLQLFGEEEGWGGLHRCEINQPSHTKPMFL